MRNIKIVALFVLITYSFLVKSQTRFSKVYDIENRSDYGMEIKYHKGNYYIYGKGGQFDTLSNDFVA